MPVLALSDGQATIAMGELSADLRCIMEEVGLRASLQALFAHYKFGTLARFVGLEDSKDALRTSLGNDFGLSARDGMQERADVADVLSVWELAKIQLEREHTLRAENKVNAITAPATALQVRAMQRVHELRHGRLEPRLIPGRYFLGKKLEELQNNEPEIERLTEVTSREEGEEDTLVTEVGKDGRLSIKKGSKKEVKPPADAEELRTRYRLLANAWLFAEARHPNRTWLADFNANTYTTLADYILGPKVLQLHATSTTSTPGTGPSPSWETCLRYEFEVRRLAYETIRTDGGTLTAALISAAKDSETRNLFLTLPFMAELAGRKGNNQSKHKEHQSIPSGGGWDKSQKAKKDKTKKAMPKKGAKGGGKGKRHGKTPDERKICYKHNNKAEKCDGSCGMVHCCQYCFETDHKTFEHNHGGA
jgi:hypothetical protein